MRAFSTPFAVHEARVLLLNPATPIFLSFAWAFVAVLTFFFGNFFATNNAGMQMFLGYVPWVYTLVIPALCMGTWAEDWRRGSAERLLTLPFTLEQLVLSRFVVLWGVLLLFLVGTWPMLATVAWLGAPDWGAIAAGYLGAWLLGGALLAFGLLASSLAGSYVVAFVGGFTLLLMILFSGWSGFLAVSESVLPAAITESLRDFSLLEHYRRFLGGLIDLRSVAYLIGLLLAGLALQWGVLTRRCARGRGWLQIAAGVLLGLAFILGGQLLPWRLDATADGMYTLSKASRTLLRGLPAPVEITVYSSRSNPDVPGAEKTLHRRLMDVLADVKAAAPDKVRITVVNPDLDVEDEIRAQKAGIVSRPLPTGQGYYLGLTASMDGRNAVLPLLETMRAPYLEFDVMSLIAEAGKIERKKLAVLSTVNLRMKDVRPQWLMELDGYYQVTDILPGQPSIPVDTDVLLVMMAPYLPQESLYAIDQYLVNGGRVMLLMDPYFRTAPSEDAATPDRNADAFALDHPADLLRGWGVVYDGLHIVGDTARGETVNEPQLGFRTYPFWLHLGPQDINNNLPFTPYVEDLLLPEAGSFKVANLAKGLAYEPVLVTTPEARMVSRKVFDTLDPQLFASNMQGEPQRYTLAMLLKGAFASLFDEVPPAVINYYRDYADAGEAPTIPTHTKLGRGNGAIFAVADNDFVSEAFTVRPGAREGELEARNDNLVFFFNALQYLAGEGDLLGIRGKAVKPRTFTRVESMLTRLSNRYARIEQKMAADLYQVAERLKELKAAQGDNQSVNADINREVEAFEIRNLRLQKQLREVRKNLRRDVLAVERTLAVFNILAMPLVALGLAFWWRRKRRQAALA